MTLPILSTLVLLGHWIIVVGLSLRVIMKRPSVGVSLAWLAVIFSLPFVGAGLYLLFGERRLGRHRAERVKANMEHVRRWQAELRRRQESGPPHSSPVASEPMQRLAEHVLGFTVQSGNELQLLNSFEAIFDAIVADIDSAQRECHVCFYIWHEGGRAADVVQALARAAKRGVRCRALADAMGSAEFLKGPMARELRDAGVELRAALPTGLFRTLVVREDLRNHRKIVVIDDRIAYTGSQNLVDPRYFKQDSGVGEWVDAMVRLSGPAATALNGVFALDWALESAGVCEDPPQSRESAAMPSGAIVQVAPSGPDIHPEALHQLLLTAIYSAQSELVMTTPYFVPDDALVTALLSAALRGVRVTLIVPARNDSMLVRYASVAHFEDLMRAGVQIALFKDGLLHTKSLTIDGATSIFGSVNLDMRSMWLNFEISLLVYDEAFTGRLRALQHAYRDRSDLLDPEVWRRRPAWRRLVENTFRLVGPLL